MTPFKRPKLQHKDFADDGNDEDSIDTNWCVIVEEAFKEAGSQVLTLEGQVGCPPHNLPCLTL